ncbi:HGGxSTG domain-containing protein [Enterobacter ludwigii]|uniref:HGGxSTG domain-containing protein n=1 Tax=Enterobacter ludwigii TaxID=299767 RepID=UPI003BEF06C6
MDKALRIKLLALRREHDAFHQRQLEVCERSDALIRAYYSTPPRFRPLVAPQRYEWQSWPEHLRAIPCGATTRAGTPCKMTTIYRNGRCKLHGGKSTGARTKAGRKRQRDGYRAWLEKQRASNAGRKRTRAYTRDVTGIGGATLAEISASATARVLSAVSGIALHFTGESLTAALTDAHSVTMALTTTSPKYGGIRWWYVCPVCEKRKAALYVSGTALICRQCAGLHYASQSK